MKKANVIFKRLKEPSTMAGLSVLLALFGIPVGTAEVATHGVVHALGGVLALLSVLMPEAGKDESQGAA